MTASSTAFQANPPDPDPASVAAARDPLANRSFLAARLEEVVNWGRKNSLWPFPFGTACCAIEYMSLVSSRFDLARFGAEFVRFSPRQADLLIVAGTITYKQAPVLRRIWEQMVEPRWVMSAGACACSGGFYDCYCTVPGIDTIVPVDVYIAGCPPRPEAYLEAVLQLQGKIQDEAWLEERRLGRHGRMHIE